VTIMEICEKDEMDIALHHVVDVAGYLAQHSIEDESRVEIQAHGSGAIRSSGCRRRRGRFAGHRRYGHRRLNEWVFGG
jgi:hypothetical protein